MPAFDWLPVCSKLRVDGQTARQGTSKTVDEYRLDNLRRSTRILGVQQVREHAR